MARITISLLLLTLACTGGDGAEQVAEFQSQLKHQVEVAAAKEEANAKTVQALEEELARLRSENASLREMLDSAPAVSGGDEHLAPKVASLQLQLREYRDGLDRCVATLNEQSQARQSRSRFVTSSRPEPKKQKEYVALYPKLSMRGNNSASVTVRATSVSGDIPDGEIDVVLYSGDQEIASERIYVSVSGSTWQGQTVDFHNLRPIPGQPIRAEATWVERR